MISDLSKYVTLLPIAGVLKPQGLAPGEEADDAAVGVLEEEGDGHAVGDGGGPGPGHVVTCQLQGLGEAGLQHVLSIAVEAGSEPVTRDLNSAISYWSGGGAALDIVVEQEAAVRIQRLTTRCCPHPQLHSSRGRHEAGPAIEVTTQLQEGRDPKNKKKSHDGMF